MKKSFSPAWMLSYWLIAIALSPFAQAASNWNDRPSWATRSYPAKEEGSEKRKATVQASRERVVDSNISPFSPGSHNVSIDVGQTFLMGDLGSKYSDSIGWQAHYNYGVSDMFAFDASLGHSSHSESKFTMTTLLTGVRMNLAWYDKVIPHLDFGLGFYRPSYTFSERSSMSPVVFGLHLGPGIDLELSKQFFFGASLTFHDMFGGNRNAPGGERVDVGGSFTRFNLRAGMTF